MSYEELRQEIRDGFHEIREEMGRMDGRIASLTEAVLIHQRQHLDRETAQLMKNGGIAATVAGIVAALFEAFRRVTT
jgi:gamma-glutamyltranspeptidase